MILRGCVLLVAILAASTPVRLAASQALAEDPLRGDEAGVATSEARRHGNGERFLAEQPAFAAPAAASSAAYRQKIKLMNPHGGNTTEILQRAADAFNSLHPEVEVEIVYVGWPDLQKSIEGNCTTKDLREEKRCEEQPDNDIVLTVVGSTWAADLYDKGILTPLDMTAWKDERQFGDVTRDFFRHLDVDYRFPSDPQEPSSPKEWFVVPFDVATWMLFYRKDLYAKYLGPNTRAPHKIEEALDNGRKIMAAMRAENASLVMYNWPQPSTGESHLVTAAFLPWVLGYGSEFVAHGGECSYTQQNFRTALDAFANMDAPVRETMESDCLRAFARGEAIHLSSPGWAPGFMRDVIGKEGNFLINASEQIGVAILPSGPMGFYAPQEGTGMAIPSWVPKGTKRDKAWEFLKFLLEPNHKWYPEIVREAKLVPAYESAFLRETNLGYCTDTCVAVRNTWPFAVPTNYPQTEYYKLARIEKNKTISWMITSVRDGRNSTEVTEEACRIFKDLTTDPPRFTDWNGLRPLESASYLYMAWALGVALGTVLVVWSTYYVVTYIRTKRQLERKRLADYNKVIDMAEEEAGALLHPMVLCSAESFLAMDSLTSYEKLRDAGKLIWLDSKAEIDAFKKDHLILFISHQWLGWGRPDPDNVHYLTMKTAIHQVTGKILRQRKSAAQLTPATLAETYIWCDFTSIAQEHRNMQVLAISSLPVYSAESDAFVIVAPTTMHCDTGMECNATTYSLRGWCRAEMLSKVCSTGLAHMYIIERLEAGIEPVRGGVLASLDMNVFEGDFSCCSIGHQSCSRCDKENLMKPMLGLYALMLRRAKDDPNVAAMARRIKAKRDKFFPKTFEFKSWREDSKGELVVEKEERDLFGPLVAMMEGRVGQHQNLPRSSAKTFSKTLSSELEEHASMHGVGNHMATYTSTMSAAFSVIGESEEDATRD
eukprot:TRINITY_DN47209_c0_g1_i1.p1 TRINITY_DN47209_c0_g1~~TRINITY_DN47209_c0_g1_i1.p1  ORF type:complete len:941 (-),score=200.64 TRINITY_DN47209_c0_g1_i1:132-2954(-)